MPKLEQQIRRTRNDGQRTFSYLGSKLWDEFLSDFNHICDMDIAELRNFLKQWKGPSLDPIEIMFETLLADLFLFGVGDILGSYFHTLWL